MQDIMVEQLHRKIQILSSRGVHSNPERLKQERSEAESLALSVLKDKDYQNPVALRLAADVVAFCSDHTSGEQTGCNSERLCATRHILENHHRFGTVTLEALVEARKGFEKSCNNDECVFSKSYKATPSVTADDLIFGGSGSYLPSPYSS